MDHKQPLRVERELRGWSQSRLADLLGTSALSVSQWERGIFLPSPYFREKLCALFEKDASMLGFLTHSSDEQSGIVDPLIPVQGVPPFGLIGRDNLLSLICEHICGEQSARFTTLYGLPGVGKTALALALLQWKELQRRFPDGVLWAGVGVQPQPIEQLRRWGKVLGMPQDDIDAARDFATLAKCVRVHIGSRRFLFVLDDVWMARDALALHVGGEHCAYIMTTRVPSLAVQLGFQKMFSVPELEREQALELLTHYLPETGRRRPEYLDQLVERVGTLPLALTLLGNYVRPFDVLQQSHRVDAVLQQLQRSSPFSLAQPQSATEHHPSILPQHPLSLQNAIAVSEYRLSPKARAAFYLLATLPSKPQSFSEETALTTMRAALEELDEICDVGLLEIHSPGRYMLHQTIAEYVCIVCSGRAQEMVEQRLIEVWWTRRRQAEERTVEERISTMREIG